MPDAPGSVTRIENSLRGMPLNSMNSMRALLPGNDGAHRAIANCPWRCRRDRARTGSLENFLSPVGSSPMCPAQNFMSASMSRTVRPMIEPMNVAGRRVGGRRNLHRFDDVAVGIAEEDGLGVAERRLHRDWRLRRGDDRVSHLLHARHDRLDVAHEELHVRRARIGDRRLLTGRAVGVLVNSVSSKLKPCPGIGSIDTRRLASGELVRRRGPSPANGRIGLESPKTSL